MVVINPTPRPQVGLLESKVLVVDFGTTGDWRDSIAALSDSFREGSFAPTVTILQCVRGQAFDIGTPATETLDCLRSSSRSVWTGSAGCDSQKTARNICFSGEIQFSA